MSGSSARQWLRACSFVVADDQGNGIELAGPGLTQVLRIRFQVNYYTFESPSNLYARVYNLSGATQNKIRSFAKKSPPVFDGVSQTTARVVLKAGYEENFGTIFEGQIYQLMTGKENSTDSYIDIWAADGDLAHNHSFMSKTLASGYTAEDIYQSCADSMQSYNVSAGAPPDGLDTTAAPRGKVLFGSTRDHLRAWSNANNCTWNINGGQLQAIPKFGVRPGDLVVINHATGQIGVPIQTPDGIRVSCLLNPAIRWGTKIRLNNDEIQQLLISRDNTGVDQTQFGAAGTSPGFKASTNWVPPIDKAWGQDGDYVVLMVQHIGDTRGNEWYSNITCLANNPTAALPQAKLQIGLPPGVAGGGTTPIGQ